MRVFGLKNCSTCRQAVTALRRAGHTVELVDVREAPLDNARLQSLADRFGEALINRRSATWRGLDAGQRAAPMLEVLARYPALMKRPVIDDRGTLHLGWGAEVQAALLGE